MEQQIAVPDPRFVGVDEEGRVRDTSVIESSGMGYDPGNMTVDLTKAEKLRTTALMLAINAYEKLIIKDAEYLREANAQARSGEGPKIQPATMNAMVQAAINFEAFLLGRYSHPQEPTTEPEKQPDASD
jgi:hypothetical protein